MREDLNQLYLVSAVGFAKMTADQFALVCVAEVTTDRLALAGDAIDFDQGEEYRG